MMIWDEIARIYSDARTYLIKNGWTQDWGSANGATCIMGAIHLSGGASQPQKPLDDELEGRLKKTLLEVINKRVHFEDYWDDPISWNDGFSREKRQVLAKLEQAAKLASEKAVAELAAQRVVLPPERRVREPERKPVLQQPQRKPVTTAPHKPKVAA